MIKNLDKKLARLLQQLIIIEYKVNLIIKFKHIAVIRA